MSDNQPDSGWWRASDGRWYQAELQPNFVAPTTTETSSTAPGAPTPLQRSGWSRTWPWLAVSTTGFLMLAMLAGLAAGPDDATGNDRIQEVRAVQRTTTTERVGPTSTAAAPTTARATTTVAPTTTAPPPSTTTPPPPTTAPPPPTPAPTAAPIPTTEYAPPPPPPPPPPMPVAAPLPEIGSGSYKNCSAARAAGAAPVYRNDPGYGAHLDRDGDGVGCEN